MMFSRLDRYNLFYFIAEQVGAEIGLDVVFSKLETKKQKDCILASVEDELSDYKDSVVWPRNSLERISHCCSVRNTYETDAADEARPGTAAERGEGAGRCASGSASSGATASAGKSNAAWSAAAEPSTSAASAATAADDVDPTWTPSSSLSVEHAGTSKEATATAATNVVTLAASSNGTVASS
jgi:hypothetical protein